MKWKLFGVYFKFIEKDPKFLDRVTGPIIEFVDKLKILDESSDKESLIKEWYSLD